MSGVELNEPHRHRDRSEKLLRANEFDHVLGSVHAQRLPDGNAGISSLYGRLDPDEVVRGHLAEVLRLVESPVPVAVLAHIDHPIRDWQAAAMVESCGFRPGRTPHDLWRR